MRAGFDRTLNYNDIESFLTMLDVVSSFEDVPPQCLSITAPSQGKSKHTDMCAPVIDYLHILYTIR